jgi:hypothetical protein
MDVSQLSERLGVSMPRSDVQGVTEGGREGGREEGRAKEEK